MEVTNDQATENSGGHDGNNRSNQGLIGPAPVTARRIDETITDSHSDGVVSSSISMALATLQR